jgi:hypothetical protein
MQYLRPFTNFADSSLVCPGSLDGLKTGTQPDLGRFEHYVQPSETTADGTIVIYGTKKGKSIP